MFVVPLLPNNDRVKGFISQAKIANEREESLIKIRVGCMLLGTTYQIYAALFTMVIAKVFMHDMLFLFKCEKLDASFQTEARGMDII